jgi:hypothetical protein
VRACVCVQARARARSRPCALERAHLTGISSSFLSIYIAPLALWSVPGWRWAFFGFGAVSIATGVVAEYSSDFRPPSFAYSTLRSALAPSFVTQVRARWGAVQYCMVL